MIHQTLTFIRRVQKRGACSALLLLLCIAVPACLQPTDHQDQLSDTYSNPSRAVVVHIDGGSYIPSLSKKLSLEWKSGMTVFHALKQAGFIKLAEDRVTIVSVDDVSLDAKMGWGLRLNSDDLKEPAALERSMEPDDSLVIFVKQQDNLPLGDHTSPQRHLK